MSKIALAALAAALGLAAAPASAADQIVLRVADHYAPSSLTAKYTIHFFMDFVTKKLGDKVKFEYYPAEQMGKAKDMLALTQQGVIDIGFVAPAYVSDKMPLSGVAELPGTYSSSCEGVRAYWPLASTGILAKPEFEQNRIRPLFAFMLPPYQVLTRQPITAMADLAGKKLRSGGAAQDLTVEAIGGVPVHMGGADVYEALSRGTLDGAVFPLQSAIDFRLTEVLKAATRGQNFGGFATTYAISLTDWGKLPDDVKAVMEEAGEATVEHACAALDADDHGPAVARMEEQGVKVSELPAEVAAGIKAKLAAVNQQWAASIDKRGLPGTEVLHAFLDALAKE